MVTVKKWWLKCLAQVLLSNMPRGQSVNRLLSSRKRARWFDTHGFNQGLHQVQLLEGAGFSLENKTVLEFGTGWKPVIPFVYRMAGAAKVILCDKTPHLTSDNLLATIDHVRNRAETAAEHLGIDVARALAVLPRTASHSFPELLDECGFEYHAPADMRETPFPDAAIDCIASRAVLEHVPEADIGPIMSEIGRLLKPQGVTIHTIDHSDHWQHRDASISRVNFLKFSDTWWRIINSPLNFQNRMRSSEHTSLIEAAGFRLIKVEAPVDETARADATRIKLHERWARLSPEQIAVLTTHVVAGKSKEVERNVV